MKFAVITLRGSRYGLRLLNALARADRRAHLALVVEDTMWRKLGLLRRVARQVGVRDAVVLATERQLASKRDGRERSWRGAPLIIEYAELAGTVVSVGSLCDEAAADALRGIDLILLGQSSVVPESLLAVPSSGTLNAHPGALPHYRGLDAPLWTLLDEDFASVGSSLHLVDARIDTGPVVLSRPYEWRGDETVRNLEARIYEDCIDLLVEGTELAERSDLRGEPQGSGRYRSIMPLDVRRRAECNLRAFLMRKSGPR